MARDVVVSVEGFKELKANLAKVQLQVERKALNKAARAGAKVIQQEAKRLAPKRKGTLRRGIIVRAGKKKKGEVAVEVKFSPKAWYGRLVEFGHLTRKGKSGKVKHVPARPFLRPAFDSKTAEATKAVGDSLRETLKEWLS